MTEQQIQRERIKQLEADGWYVIKLTVTNKTGIPDLIAVKNNDVLFVEVKRPKGIVSEIQKFRHKELRSKGIKVEIYRGKSN
jgi:Holliday junction resolvase